jgi:hypothetical protein
MSMKLDGETLACMVRDMKRYIGCHSSNAENSGALPAIYISSGPANGKNYPRQDLKNHCPGNG